MSEHTLVAEQDLGLMLVAVACFVAVALAADGLITLASEWRWRLRRPGPGGHHPAQFNHGDDNVIALPAVSSVLRTRALSRLPWLDRQLSRIAGIGRIETLLRQAGVSWTVGRVFGLAAASLLAASFALLWIAGNHPESGTRLLGVALLALPAAALWPLALAAHRRGRRLRAFAEQLPDALDIMSRALRAGYSTMGALKVVGEEMPEPLGAEFGQTHDEITFGTSPQLALNHLVDRMPSEELRYMVIAMLVQRETGGNLSEVLDKIARLMRERIKLALQVRTLSADGRFSAVVLCLLPFVTVGLVYLINRGYIEQLWTTAGGMKFLTVSALMMTAGIVWIRSIVKIRF